MRWRGNVRTWQFNFSGEYKVEIRSVHCHTISITFYRSPQKRQNKGQCNQDGKQADK